MASVKPGLQNPMDDMADMIVEKGELILTISLDNKEQAMQIITWMHCKPGDHPMLSTLDSISWDQTVVSKKLAEAIETLRAAL
jgi:hypothetical protein